MAGNNKDFWDKFTIWFCIFAVMLVLLVDTDAEERQCATYPEWCDDDYGEEKE